MSVIIHLAYLGWLLVSLAVHAMRPPRQAVLITYIGGTLFLPNAGYDFYALHEKLTIIAVGTLLCSVIFHARLWSKLRLRLFDLPMVVWCLVPFASARSNHLGTYEALSGVLEHFLLWGLPYFLGRLHFSSLEGLRDLAVGIFVGGLVYVPFCLWEVRMSPQLHRLVYGFHQATFLEMSRFGGFRPMVFMRHGLQVAMWMTAAALLGIWLWRSRALRWLWRIPIAWFFPPLLVTVVLCKSLNGIALFLIGCAVFVLTRSLRTAVPLLCLLIASPLYMFVRTTGRWSGDTLVAATKQMINADRAESLGSRFYYENMLIEKALERKVVGWGRWGRSRIYDETGKDVTATDGLWVITFGQNGLVGLAAFWTSMLLAVIVFWRRCSPRYWTHRKIAPAAALAVLLVLYMIDNLLNSMGHLVFVFAAGGLIGLRRVRHAATSATFAQPATTPLTPLPSRRVPLI